MSNFDTDEEGDFSFGQQNQGNRLASLFKADTKQSSSNSDSLKYKAPKQPKTEQNEANNKINILFLSTVQVFKYINNTYENQGKTACTIVGNHVSNQLIYNLILYVDKTQPIANIKIHDNFKLVIQANNYVSFYDDRSQPWSVMFESDKLLIDFATKITLCKCNLQSLASADVKILQDLRLSSNEPNAAQIFVESNDSIEISTQVTQWNDYKLGDIIENTQSKAFKVKLGKGKLPKFVEDSIINMKLGGRRLIVSKTNKFAPFYQEISQSTIIFYDINILRIKKASAVAETKEEEKLETQFEESRSRSSSIKEKSKALNEQLSDPAKTEKSKLISRMAKMGQQMLPLSGATIANIESEDEQQPQDRRNQTQPVIQQQLPQVQAQYQQPLYNYPVVQEQSYHQQQPIQAQPFQQYQQTSNQLALFKPSQASNQAPIVTYVQNPLPMQQLQQQTQQQQASIISEEVNIRNQQQQQTLIIKLDTLNEKLEQIKSMQQVLNSQSNVNYPNLETGVLLYNITKVIKENEQYKKDLFEKSQKIDELNNKITELLARNQNFVEKSHALLESKNDSFQSNTEKIALRVLELEQDKMRLTGELSKTTAMISDLNIEINRLNLSENELKLKLSEISKNTDTFKNEIDRLRIDNAELQAKLDQSTDDLKTLRGSRKQLELKSTNKDEEINELKSNITSLEKTLTERKDKYDNEKQQLLNEIDDLKAQNQIEIRELKEKLSKFKQNSSQVASEQIKQLEAELTKEWESKCEKLLKTQELKLRREIDQLNEDKTDNERRIQELTNQLKLLRSSNSRIQTETDNYKQTIEELNIFKEKYERLQSQALTMKERYESRIKELLEAEPDPEVIAEEVKRTMNGIYRKLKTQIKPDEYYVGNGILSAMLRIIKMVTMQILHNNDDNDDNENEIDYFSQHIFDINEQLKKLSSLHELRENEKPIINETKENIPQVIKEREEFNKQESIVNEVDENKEDIQHEKKEDEAYERKPDDNEFEIVNASNEDDSFTEEENEKNKEDVAKHEKHVEIAASEIKVVDEEESETEPSEVQPRDSIEEKKPEKIEEFAVEENMKNVDEKPQDKVESTIEVKNFAHEELSVEETKNIVEVEKKVPSIFDDVPDDLGDSSSPSLKESPPKVEQNEEEEVKKPLKKTSLFDDDDDDDDLLTFITSKPKSNSFKTEDKTQTSSNAATNFEPPPLFDDDEGITSSKDDIDWFK